MVFSRFRQPGCGPPSKCWRWIGILAVVLFFGQSVWQAFRYGRLVGQKEMGGIYPSGNYQFRYGQLGEHKEPGAVYRAGNNTSPVTPIQNNAIPNNGCDEEHYICLKKGHEFESVLNGHPSAYNREETLEAVARDDVERRGIQARGDPWDAGGKNLPHTLNTWEPFYHCPFEERVGPFGDGGKWMCRVRDYAGPACVAYSFGCNGDVRWERDLVRITGCDVHIYDPTPWVVSTMTYAPRETEEQTKTLAASPRFPYRMPYGVKYHGWGLFESSNELARSVVKRLNPTADGGTLGEIVNKTGGPVPQIVKVDIEGSEWFLNFTADAATWQQVHMFMVEIHLKDVGAGFYKGSLSEWEYVRDWIHQIEGLDFRMYHKEVNVYQGDGSCWEIAFVNMRFF
ncbi:hypothetical protein CBR_g654 [Chara braunii]|uniref:Methyltransferase domain-containing protein n=1 Tax=Chara braunii TaxID=69332 RepID=A0A388KBT6_CHABU|nr:hypothetical protein CBR_g654 [Chara braunii]|eukprot:GBG67524.1 hypothetical protein CBR_g654 [Chara braunii]